LDKEKYPDFVYLRSANGKKILDRGMLPLNIPEVKVYSADPTHRKKVTCKNLHKHAKSAKKTVNTEGLT